jgi:Skp family chaperone for outer membrane proteins
MKIALTLALAATSALTFAAVASAQAQGQPALAGPVVPGVCVYNYDKAVASSAVGRSMTTRLEQLAGQIKADLQQRSQSLQTEQAALQSQAATLPKDQLEQKGQAFEQKVNDFERLRQFREAQLKATGEKEVGVITEQIDPLLHQVYAEHNCGLVVAANATYGYYNQQMDVTQAVISKLDAKITTLSFDLVQPQQQQAAAPAAAAPAPAPAAATPKKKK